MSGLDLGSQARRFAQVLQDVLNRTVCNSAQVNAVINSKTKSAHIGTRLSRTDFMTDKIQMRSRARTRIWLDVSSTWYRNDEGFLTAKTTYCGVYLGDAHEHLVLHYDYERDKDLYTEAHIQVAGTHPELERMLDEVGRTGDHMKDLHLPVGGRRLRPSIEDLLESLIDERLLDPKPGYEKVLNDSRRTTASSRSPPSSARTRRPRPRLFDRPVGTSPRSPRKASCRDCAGTVESEPWAGEPEPRFVTDG